MQVWLVRHAVAADRQQFEGPDGDRPLTDKGRKRFRSFARWLADEALPPAAIVTSPLVRAVQTADILRKELGLKKKDVLTADALSSGAEPHAILEVLRTQSAERIALVGHEPDFSRALGKMISGGEFAFGKGAVAAVEFEGVPDFGAGKLCWFVGPKLHRDAGEQ
ncbi:MAG: SixA phosphatase family protein [Planctomycetaceae bacterium]